MIAAASKAQGKHAAGLRAEALRAGEHVIFAALQLEARLRVEVHPRLEERIEHEFEKLMKKSAEHEASEQFVGLKTGITFAAQQTFKEGNYSAALELARAAKVLAETGD